MPFPELSATETEPLLDHYRVIDVREEYEFNGPLGFIEHSELVPLSEIRDRAEELAGSQPLLLVCRSGKRSAKACETLQALGLQDVTNLAGGMIAWNLAELPLSRTEPKSLAELCDKIILWVAQVTPLTKESAREEVQQQFDKKNVTCAEPSHTALEEYIDFVADSLNEINPPDLDLSLAFFRSSLAVL